MTSAPPVTECVGEEWDEEAEEEGEREEEEEEEVTSINSTLSYSLLT